MGEESECRMVTVQMPYLSIHLGARHPSYIALSHQEDPGTARRWGAVICQGGLASDCRGGPRRLVDDRISSSLSRSCEFVPISPWIAYMQHKVDV